MELKRFIQLTILFFPVFQRRPQTATLKGQTASPSLCPKPSACSTCSSGLRWNPSSTAWPASAFPPCRPRTAPRQLRSLPQQPGPRWQPAPQTQLPVSPDPGRHHPAGKWVPAPRALQPYGVSPTSWVSPIPSAGFVRAEERGAPSCDRLQRLHPFPPRSPAHHPFLSVLGGNAPPPTSPQR